MSGRAAKYLADVPEYRLSLRDMTFTQTRVRPSADDKMAMELQETRPTEKHTNNSSHQMSGLCACAFSATSISPRTAAYRRWHDVVVLSAVLACCLGIFMASMDSTSLALWTIVYMSDAMYISDIIISFYTAYEGGDGVLVTNRRQIRKHYILTTFVPDLLSVLPTELVFLCLLAGGTKLPVWKTLTLLRLNRLLRLHKVLNFFGKREEEIDSNTLFYRSLKYLTISLLTVHILTCCWFVLACNGTHDGVVSVCRDGTWATVHDLGFDLARADTVKAYTVSLYWAVATATSTGYGDIYAVNTAEQWYSIISMLAGIAVFFGMLLGGMTSVLTNMDARRADYVHRFHTIQTNMDELSVPEDLKERVIGYYEYMWQRKKGVSTEGIYKDLPVTFQAEVSHAINSSTLQTAPLFKGLDKGFLRMLSLSIKNILCLPNQIIIKRGDIGKHMYYIHRGEVEVLSEDDDETPIALLKAGKIFGEVSLVYSLPRTATVRAATHCDLMVLNRTDLEAILQHYPQIADHLSAEAKNRCSLVGTHIPHMAASNPHFEALQPRRTSFIEPSHLRRNSFAPSRKMTSLSKIHALKLSESVEILQTDQDDPIQKTAVHEKVSVPQRIRGCCELCCQTLLSRTIKNSSTILSMWHPCIVSVCVIIGVIYPYMAAFTPYDPRSGYADTLFGRGILVFTYILDLILVMDIVFKLRTEFDSPYGSFADFKTIFRNYVKTSAFYIDVACVLPLELFCFLPGAAQMRWDLFTILRLNRLLKLAEVPRFFDQLESSLHLEISKLRTVKLVVYISLLSHWAACTFFIMACSGPSCTEGSWIVVRNSTVLTDTPISEYITALYWAVATMTSTGYGDINANVTLGRAMSLIFMMVGLLLYGYCLALMAATLANADAPRVRFQERLFAVKAYMRERNLGTFLEQRVINYMGLVWRKYRGDWMPGQAPLMGDIPLVLQQDIIEDDALKTLAKVPLFKNTEDCFVRDLGIRAQTFLFSPGDVIIYAGDMGREMYCIRRGWCKIMTPDLSGVLANIGPGQYFGEVGMLFGDYRTASVKAATHVEVVMLTMDDVNEATKSYPVIKRQFIEAVSRKEHLMDLQKEALVRLPGITTKEEITKVEFKSITESVETSNMTRFSKQEVGGALNKDYLDPFKELNLVSRIFSCVLMRSTFHPGGKHLKIWTGLMVAVAAINSVVVALQASLFYDVATIWTLGYILDLILIINLYLWFHIGYYNDEGMLVTHPLSTARHYLQTNFAVDFFANFPFELLFYAAYPRATDEALFMFALTRLNRLFQVYRLPLMFGYLESSVERQTGLLRQIKFGFYIVIFFNWMTCAMFVLACPLSLSLTKPGFTKLSSGPYCLNSSWLLHTNFNFAIENATLGTLYTTCLYWATATTVSVGYGDISAYTQPEMILSLIAMVIGVIFFGYIIASVAASLANADTQRARFQEKLSAIKRYLEEKDMDEGLLKRIVAYFEYAWLRTKGNDPDTLFNILPIALWGDVTLSLYNETLSNISLFKDTEIGFIKMLSRCVKPILYLKGEYIVKKYDMGQEMFFIQRGAVDVTNEEGTMIFDTMRPGASFGEVALLFSVPRTASIRAHTNADLFSLAKQDLDSVLELYPAIKQKVMMIGEERRQQARQRSAAKAQVATPPPPPPPAAESQQLETSESQGSTEDEGSNENNSNVNINQNNSIPSLDNVPYTSLADWDDLALGYLDLCGLLNTNQNKSAGKADIASLNMSFNNSKLNTNQNNDEKNADVPVLELFAHLLSEDAGSEQPVPTWCQRVIGRVRSINRFTINPAAEWLKNFNTVICIVGILSAWTISYQAAYQDHHPALIAVNYFFDIFYFVEIYMRFHLAFRDEYGDLMEDFDMVFKTYLKKVDGFSIDLITVMPVDLFAFAAPPGKKLLALSYLRLLHMLRLRRVSIYFDSWEKELNINMLSARLCKFFVALSLLIHFLSCFWYELACPLGKCTGDSWIVGYDVQASITSYCLCVYWTVATMTSTGYGDIHANNVQEMLFASMVMVSGKLMFGFILGNIASTLANKEAQKVKFQEKLQTIKDAMVDQEVPHSLRQRVTNYITYLWYRTKGIDNRQIFMDAPTCLVAELFRNVTDKMLMSIPLLEGAEESFLRSVSMEIKQTLFIPGDHIVRKGEVGKEVYYIHKGEVEVLTSGCSGEEGCEQVEKVLRAGDIFGEVNLVAVLPRQMDIRARTHVDVYSLSKEDFEKALENFPTVAVGIHQKAQLRFQDILH